MYTIVEITTFFNTLFTNYAYILFDKLPFSCCSEPNCDMESAINIRKYVPVQIKLSMSINLIANIFLVGKYPLNQDLVYILEVLEI